jgi:hypothetical protein
MAKRKCLGFHFVKKYRSRGSSRSLRDAVDAPDGSTGIK